MSIQTVEAVCVKKFEPRQIINSTKKKKSTKPKKKKITTMVSSI